jgi:hypothetical protein
VTALLVLAGIAAMLAGVAVVGAIALLTEGSR